MYPGVYFIRQQTEHFKVKNCRECMAVPGSRPESGLGAVQCAHSPPPPRPCLHLPGHTRAFPGHASPPPRPCAPSGMHTCVPWARAPPPMCTCRDAHVRSPGMPPVVCTCRDAHVRAPERLAKRVSRGSQSPPGVEPTRNSSPGERWWFPARKATGHETRPSTTQNLTRWGCQIQRDKTSRTLN